MLTESIKDLFSKESKDRRELNKQLKTLEAQAIEPLGEAKNVEYFLQEALSTAEMEPSMMKPILRNAILKAAEKGFYDLARQYQKKYNSID